MLVKREYTVWLRLFIAILFCSAVGTHAAAPALALPQAAGLPTTIAINDVSVTEPVNGQSTVAFTITASSNITQTVSVDYATSDGTATAGSDYVALSAKTLSLLPAKQSAVVVVTIKSDTRAEGSETFFLNLFKYQNAEPLNGKSQGIATINDPPPSLSIGDRSVTEGNNGSVRASFAVSLSAASAQPVSVGYHTANGSAVTGADYITTSGTLVFPANSTAAQSISVLVNGDQLDEDNETFFVDLYGPSNATLLKAQGVGTITDDDLPPNISVKDLTVVEGNAGTTSAEFSLSLSAPSGKPVTVSASTSDGSAVGGSDYVSIGSTTRSFPIGSTTITLPVTIIGDLSDEDNETFNLNLSSPANASILDGLGVATITNDDLPPTITIGDASVPEGDAGTSDATFAVTLSVASGKTVTVNYQTIDGTAKAGGDYTGQPSATLTIPPGVFTQNIAVPVIGDTVPEDNENFFVNLSSPNNATILDGQGQGTIQDNDAQPLISISDAGTTEGTTGNTATFVVALSMPSGRVVTVNYATADGTALGGSDYAPASGSISFPPNVTSETIAVPVNADGVAEGTEFFFVNLTGANNSVIADGQAIGTIVDGAGPTISIDNLFIGEPASGTRDAIFSVRLSSPSPIDVAVDFATADGSATAGLDYQARAGRLVIPAHSQLGSIVVPINADAIGEANETLFVNLGNPANALLGRAQASATIIDVAGTADYRVYVPTVRH